jgi:hypothetical protein
MYNDKTNSSTSDTEKAIAGADVNAQKIARRRLLRMGATAGATVMVTLASRPALACTCVMPSAWGSILATGQTDLHKLAGSVSHHKSADFSSWTIASWRTNGTQFGGGNCRNVLADKIPVKLARLNGLTVNDLRNKLGYNYAISGLVGNPKWVDLLNSGSAFVVAILVAELNIYTSGRLPTECGELKTIVKDMADGSYTPASGATMPWGQQEIADYLHYNWLARR